MFKNHTLACALALAFPIALVTSVARADDKPVTPPATSTQLDRVDVRGTRDRLDAARNLLSPETGSSVYRFDQADLAKLPLGDATPLNQVLLRAPGVVQDSFAAGQLHVRGDHANLQYRVNGIVIPESVSGFGAALDTRFADQISLLTGALPAQYGYRTAGVVDIRTKGTAANNGGSLDLTIGSHGHRETGLNVGGSTGGLSYFASGSYLSTHLGIENPTGSANALHDDSRQAKGFAYLSYLLGGDSRISLMAGNADSRFQIPNVPGEAPQFTLAGVAAPSSDKLRANQSERSNFQVLSLQSSVGPDIDYQVSLFRRGSDVHYEPDAIGDLVYTGIAANTVRRNDATGVQADASYRLTATHTVRAGLFAQKERGGTDNTSAVFPVDGDGNPGTTPITIVDNKAIGGHLYGIYLQDEWQPTKAVTINYGARWDKVATVVAESQLSPRLGATFDLTPQTRIHAGYARYFTPPPTEKIDQTSIQKFLGTTNELPSDANTAVRSERSDYFDAGISHQLTPQLTLGADAYYRKVRHLQDEGQFGSAFIYSAFNYDRGRIYGLELSASYKDSRWSGYANVALSAARGKGVETGQFNFDQEELDAISRNYVHLDHEEKLTASAGLAYQLGSATSVSGEALFGSGLRKGFANTDNLPSHVQLNATLSHSIELGSFGKLDARLSVVNLLDRVYQLRDGSGIGVGAPQFGERRSVYLALSKPFSF